MIYLYAIVDGLARVDDVSGIAHETLAIVRLESFSAVTGVLAEVPPVDRRVLEAQDTVVRTLHGRSAALLPMRFGAAYPSVEHAARAIRTRAAAIAAALAIVHGREQMTLWITGTAAPAAPSGSSGTDYLKARAAAVTPAAITPLLDALKPLQRATRVEASTTAGLIARVYQLIERGSSAEYLARVDDAARGLHRAAVRVSGPGPCYAFGGGNEGPISTARADRDSG